jgi:hypothetical protein
MIDIQVEDITDVEKLTDLMHLGQLADLVTDLGTASPKPTEQVLGAT